MNLDDILIILLLYSSIYQQADLETKNMSHYGNESVKFKWSVAMESAVDSSFFWGYLVTQVPGGFLASAYPANRIFGTAIAISSFLNLFMPGAMSFSPLAVIVIKVMQGFVEVRFIFFCLVCSQS